jgi:hypothetical protein
MAEMCVLIYLHPAGAAPEILALPTDPGRWELWMAGYVMCYTKNPPIDAGLGRGDPTFECAWADAI